MELSRRDALKLGLAGGAGLLLPAGLSGCSSGLFAGNDTAEGSAGAVLKSKAKLPKPFTTPLPVPPVLKPVRSDSSTDYYEITQKVGKADILPGGKTEVWGYNGTFPGPTIESRRGRKTVVRHRNELDVPTVVHLHGGKNPHQFDGYPTDLITPVGGWSGPTHGGELHQGHKTYEYPVDQPPTTLWYHDHRMDFTGPQVYYGLAGFHLIRDDEEESLDLPHGERDIPLMIVDRAFAGDGSFHYPALDPSLKKPGVKDDYMSGVLGDCILVNGAPWPVLEVTNTRYRFRILNASNARRYRLALDPAPAEGSPFVQVGSDQGLLPAPVRHEKIEVAQAERFDVVIDFSGYSVGDKVTLVNERGDSGTANVMRFVVARKGKEDSRIPSKLVDFRPLSRSDATVHREFTFKRGGAERNGVTLWTVNGKPFDPDRMDAKPELGAVELWKVRSLNVEHPIHIHLVRFQILSKGGSEPSEYDKGWKDTVNMDSGGSAELLMRFDGYRGKYVFHCHNLEHEDMMMMANFKVR
ncbi:MAG: multicopper oxidase family protein [Streptosporangiales bacterium]